MVARLNGRCPILFPAGVSTFGRQINWAPEREAVPFGRKKGEILSGNTSPTPGTDTAGATAIIKSYCKADLIKQTNGAALDIKLYPSTVQGANGVEAIISLLMGFVKLGGSFMQLDIVDAEALRLAQEHPDDYKSLSVRVSGWNARFVTLNKEWQNMIIERTAQGV
jgi:pyruvate-formate lyase